MTIKIELKMNYCELLRTLRILQMAQLSEIEIKSIIKKIVSTRDDVGTIYSYSLFDMLVTSILEYHDKPVHSLVEMKDRRKTKTKGDLWEVFCKLYLKNKYDNVWLLSEVPEDILVTLGLNRRDVGIDIIAQKGDKFTAVQCKFKKPRTGLVPGTWIPYNCVNWKELSTFYALCSKTNGNKWQKHIVMTNTKYVRHMGNKTYKDKSICCGTFNKLTRMDLLEMISDATNIKNDSITKNKNDITKNKNDLTKNKNTLTQSLDSLREARLKFFEKVK